MSLCFVLLEDCQSVFKFLRFVSIFAEWKTGMPC